MPFQRTLIVALLAALALAAAATCMAQIPEQMNYQVMLTDDADQPLADQSVQLVFRIYNADAGGGSLWTETHNVITSSIGVVSVVLGSTNPLAITFDGPLWLQVEVDGEVLSPRRELTSAPYALSAGGGASGDGHSLDADDGDPTDVVYVAQDGSVYVGSSGEGQCYARLRVWGSQDDSAGHFYASSSDAFGVGLFASADSSSAIVANTGTGETTYYPSVPTAVCGMSNLNGHGGMFIGMGTGDGVVAQAWGGGNSLTTATSGTGYSGYFSGGNGVAMVLQDYSDQYPVLDVTNNETSTYGDCLHLTSASGVSPFSYTLNSHCRQGNAGRFDKDTDDDRYAVHVLSPSTSSEGLYVHGYFYSTSPLAREVETSRGKEAVFSVSAAEVEMTTSGQGQLVTGTARVEFDRIFAESVTGPRDVRITVTPVGGWSAIYVERIDADGFDLRSESGRDDIVFHWAAVGRAAGHERAPEITIPDRDEEERVQKLKEEEIRAGRPSEERPDRLPVMLKENLPRDSDD